MKPKLSGRRRRVRVAVRKSRWAVVALLAVALLVAADRAGLFGLREPTAGEDYQRYHGRSFRTVRVIDGDTLDVDLPDGRREHTRIRLWGVDTPETRHPQKGVQHFGPEAADFTRAACRHRTVRLELLPGRTRDRYRRLLAYVFLPDGRLLNRELVRLGFGYADPRYRHPRREEFLQLQDDARADRRGLWENVREAELPYYLQGESAATRR